MIQLNTQLQKTMRHFTFTDKLSREEFNSLALEQGSKVKAHFLGSYEWGEVSEQRNRTPHYVGVREDGRLVATALILERALVAGYTYFYIPRGFTMDYSDRELLRYMTESLREFGRRRKALYFKIDPDIRLHTVDIEGNVVPGENNEALAAYLEHLGYRRKPLNYGFENEQPRFTFRIPLEDGIEAVESRYSRTTRTRIRQALEAGVEVYEGTSSDIPEFVRLMTMTEKRQGFFSHEPEFYQYFYDILAASGMVTLYFGRLDVPQIIARLEREHEVVAAELAELSGRTGKKTAGRIKEAEKKLAAVERQLEGLADKPKEKVTVSTYLITHYADKAWALYAANDMDYGKFFANYAVYQRQIRDSCEAGRKIFDVFGTVGRPEEAGSTAGLYEFKKKWGGELTEFIGEFDYVLNKPVYEAYSRLIPMYHDLVNRRLMKQVETGSQDAPQTTAVISAQDGSSSDPPFIAVALGGDMNCYGVARTFYEAYGIRSVLLGRTPIFPTASSGLFTDKLYDRDLLDDDVLIRLLTEVEERHKGVRKFLFGTNDDYVRHIIHNRSAIEAISPDFIIPMITEELFDRLDDKDTFYAMCEEYGLPYPKTVIFDCVKDTVNELELPFDYPVFIKPVSNVIYFDFEFEGKQKGYRIDSRGELAEVMGRIQAAGYPDRFVIQEYIDGDDDSMYIYSAYCDRSGRVVMTSGGHILMHDRTPELIGNYNAIEGARDDSLTDRLRDFLEKIGFTGICHFDVQYDARRGDYVVYEINIRQGRSNYYMTASGMNYASLLVEDYLHDAGSGQDPSAGTAAPPSDNAADYIKADRPFIVSNVSRAGLAGAVGRSRAFSVPKDRFFRFQLAPYDRSVRNEAEMLRIERSILKNYRKYR